MAELKGRSFFTHWSGLKNGSGGWTTPTLADSRAGITADGHPAQTCRALQHAMRVASNQRDGTQLHHVVVEGLAEWIAWWDGHEASA